MFWFAWASLTVSYRPTTLVLFKYYLGLHSCNCPGLYPLRWRHNERDGVSNHQRHDCLRNRLFKRRSNEKEKLRVTGLCVGISPVTGEFPAQRACNMENVSIWWRHHENVISWDAPHVYLLMRLNFKYPIFHTLFRQYIAVLMRHFCLPNMYIKQAWIWKILIKNKNTEKQDGNNKCCKYFHCIYDKTKKLLFMAFALDGSNVYYIVDIALRATQWTNLYFGWLLGRTANIQSV